MMAYSIAVPILPDLSRRLGASPTLIGLLFASFGVTLLGASLPMGAVSDRIGRRVPLVGALITLALATLMFAYANRLEWLFAARLTQGLADAVTWVVGFALIADMYGPSERGRVTGIVMSGTGLAFILGPSIGGWLYEIGGMRLPFVTLALVALLLAVAFLCIDLPAPCADRPRLSIAAVLRTRDVRACALTVVAASATVSMLEPLMAMHLAGLGLTPGRIGLVFTVAAVATTMLHPLYGRIADRRGARRVTLTGLGASACVLPLVGQSWSFESAVVLFVLQASAAALAITPSLAYMAEVASRSGMGSFGVAFGIYNFAWGVGLLGGPAAGGLLFDRLGFRVVVIVWAMFLLLATAWVGLRSQRSSLKEET